MSENKSKAIWKNTFIKRLTAGRLFWPWWSTSKFFPFLFLTILLSLILINRQIVQVKELAQLPTPTRTPSSPAAGGVQSGLTPTLFALEYVVITETPTPTPTPKPTLTPTPTKFILTGDYLDNLFTKYAQIHSVDLNMLKKIAVCESKLNPQARNGDYGGMYQFSSGAWKNARRAMNNDDNPDLRFNAEESIRTAAFRISTSGTNSWPNCR